jgi:hypothetical protein
MCMVFGLFPFIHITYKPSRLSQTLRERPEGPTGKNGGPQ